MDGTREQVSLLREREKYKEREREREIEGKKERKREEGSERKGYITRCNELKK